MCPGSVHSYQCQSADVDSSQQVLWTEYGATKPRTLQDIAYSVIPFQFIFIIDCQPHPTPYCRWPSFLGRRCTCLEQSARPCHFRTFRSSLLVLA